jgi:hypothetical protein
MFQRLRDAFRHLPGMAALGPWALACLLCLGGPAAWAQDDDLFGELEGITERPPSDVIATFKSTRILLMPSIERVTKRQLHFRVAHLFGPINSGIASLYGLDELSNMHLSFEYGLSDRVQLGLLRSNKPDKTLQGNVKWSLLRQQADRPGSFSLSYFGSLDVKTRRYTPEARNRDFAGRIDYVNMLLLGKKISPKLSLQLSPVYIHRNLTETPAEPNSHLLLGIGGRYLLNEHISANFEYYRNLPAAFSPQFERDLFSLGFDIETGGHVFQLYFTNALALHPGKALINQNESFFDGHIQFGFSILRAFNIKTKKS